MMRALALLLLASCSVPDEIGVGTSASQYDFLGAGEMSPVANDTGNEFGVQVWGVWKTRPQRIVMVTPEREGGSMIEDRLPSPIVNVTQSAPEIKPAESAIEQAMGVGDKLDGWSDTTKVLVVFLAVCLMVLGWLKLNQREKPKP